MTTLSSMVAPEVVIMTTKVLHGDSRFSVIDLIPIGPTNAQLLQIPYRPICQTSLRIFPHTVILSIPERLDTIAVGWNQYGEVFNTLQQSSNDLLSISLEQRLLKCVVIGQGPCGYLVRSMFGCTDIH